ncbi:metal-sulfur cluster assembly factor [Maridesulfovibrio zosterae]|uniref:metal-sulfur cluster assembly factor n=1 Tax=Maridesulfovibrio zosterae TaxID=82171 RepID=UPI000553B0C8|nr:metal-sulfur cluster assembly factor [Maridesulfovibrio zosterae]
MSAYIRRLHLFLNRESSVSFFYLFIFISFLFSICPTVYADNSTISSAMQKTDQNTSFSLTTGSTCEKQILLALKEIKDPELNINIVDLGLLKELNCPNESDDISITIIMTSPFCPYIKTIVEDIRTAASKISPNKKTKIIVDTKTRWKASRMSKEGRKQLWGEQ